MPETLKKATSVSVNLLISAGLVLGFWSIYAVLLPSDVSRSDLPTAIKVTTAAGVLGGFLVLAGIGIVGAILEQVVNGQRDQKKMLILAVVLLASGALLASYYWQWLTGVTS